MSKEEIQQLLQEGNTRWGIRALCQECQILSDTSSGRSPQLYDSALKLYSIAKGGNLVKERVEAELVACMERNGGIPDNGWPAFWATMRQAWQNARERYPADDVEVEAEQPKSNGLDRSGLVCAADIEPERIDWLWEGVLAKGKLSTIASDPGLGKSQLGISCAAILSTGGTWPGSSERVAPGNVVILSCEDGAADTIVPRLIGAGADRKRVFIMPGARDMKKDVPKLAELTRDAGGCSLVIVDPISAYMGGMDINNSGDVRGITNELTSFAEEHGASILLIHHLNKNTDRKAAYRLIGSQSWQAASRAVYIVERDTDDIERRIMAPSKGNLGPDTTGYAFRIETVMIPGDIKTSRVIWDDSSHTTTADQTIDKAVGGDALNEAIDLCRELLKNGRVLSTVANKTANDLSISESTLRRAKQRLGIRTTSYDGWITTYWEYKDKAA